LPLAIDQVGAFIAQNASSPAKYLALLESHGAGLFDHAAVGADPQRTVARVWRTTFDRLAENPLAVQMLRVLAWLAPTGIRRHFGDPLTHGAALNLLAAYHLVTLSPDAISVHPLVQEISRTPSDDDPYRSAEVIAQARDYATGLLMRVGNECVSGRPEDWPAQRRVFPHIEALAANTRPEDDTEQRVVLFGWLGLRKHGQGDYRDAITYLTRAADGYERLFGQVHERAIRFRMMLGCALRDAGEAARWLEIQKALLPIAIGSLGATHPLTSTVRASLGSAYSAAGEHEKAITELRALRELCIEEHGEQDPNTRLAHINLAYALAQAGRAEEAVEIYEARYAETLSEEGQDVPAALQAANDFGTALQGVGQTDRAIEMLEHVVNRRKQVLGDEHPDTLNSMANLVVALLKSGDYSSPGLRPRPDVRRAGPGRP
jgi:hypothetical protein